MESKTQYPDSVRILNISQVVIPQEMKNLYDYASRTLEVDTLKSSIDEFTQIEPITVVEVDQQFYVINGVLRLTALLCSEKNEIDAIVLNIDTTTEDFSLCDLIVHSQIKKEKTAKEKMLSLIHI
jgi:ParB-like chromosome segregation protein Spo0J